MLINLLLSVKLEKRAFLFSANVLFFLCINFDFTYIPRRARTQRRFHPVCDDERRRKKVQFLLEIDLTPWDGLTIIIPHGLLQGW